MPGKKRKSSVPKGHKVQRLPPGPVPETYLLGELVPTAGIGGHMMGVGPVTYYPGGTKGRARRGRVNPITGWTLEEVDRVNETAALSKGDRFLTIGLDPFVPGNYYAVIQDSTQARKHELTYEAKSLSDAVHRAVAWAEEQMKSRKPRQNKGTPPKAKWISKAITRPGKLGGKGFLSKPRDTQKKILRKCVDHYGYRSCLGSVMILERIPATQSKYGRTLATLRRFLVKDYGGPGSFGPQANPHQFTMVPEITGCPVCQIKTNAEFRKLLENPTLAERWEALKEGYRAGAKTYQQRVSLAKQTAALKKKLPKLTKSPFQRTGGVLTWTDEYGTVPVEVNLSTDFGVKEKYLSVNEIFPDGSYGNEIAKIFPDDEEWESGWYHVKRKHKKKDMSAANKLSSMKKKMAAATAFGGGARKKSKKKKAKKKSKKNPSRAERAAIGGGAGALLLGPVGALAGGYLGVKTAKKKSKKKARKNPRDVLRRAMRGT